MFSENIDYYKILEIDKNASDDEIRKKYRTLSMRYHPDRNSEPGADVKMGKINEAYEILGDKNKRNEYDMFNSPNQFNSAPDIFNMLFSNLSKGNSSHHHMPPFFKVFNMSNLHNDKNVSNIEEMFAQQIQQDLENMFVTGSVNTNIENNNKSKESKKQERMLKPSTIHVHVSIDIYQAYNGCSLPVEIDREIWHDQSIREKEKETIYVSIPKGIDDNEVILLKEKGHINFYNMSGDVKVHIKVKNDSEFVRNGIDLILHKNISLKESLCGFYFEIKHITGKVFKINNKLGNIITPEFKKKIENMGMIRENHTGDLIIIFHVKYPENIDIEKLKQLQEILE